jgi:hypothetical protein
LFRKLKVFDFENKRKLFLVRNEFLKIVRKLSRIKSF